MARARQARSGGGGSSGASGSAAVLRFRNRTLNTFRGTEANAYGDESDVGQPYLTGVPAALAETSQQAFDAATQRNQIIRSITCRVDAWADIITTDTIQDTTTGIYYLIENIEAVPGIGYYPAPKLLTLRVRSGVSISSD
jgi:hypothetical protein